MQDTTKTAERYILGMERARADAASGLPWPDAASISMARTEAAWARRNGRRGYRAYWLGYLRHVERHHASV